MLIRYSFSKYLPLINLEMHSILSFVKALLLLAYFTKKKKKGELSVKEEVRSVAAKIPHVLSSCRLPRGWDQTPYTGICFGLRTNWVLRPPSSQRAWKYQKTEGIAMVRLSALRSENIQLHNLKGATWKKKWRKFFGCESFAFPMSNASSALFSSTSPLSSHRVFLLIQCLGPVNQSLKMFMNIKKNKTD